MKKSLLAMLASVVVLGGSTTAFATTVTYTFSGTVTNQFDDGNQFNTTNFVGQTYTDAETFNLGSGVGGPSPGGFAYLGSSGGFATSVLSIGGQSFTTSSFGFSALQFFYPQPSVVSPPSSVHTSVNDGGSTSISEDFAGSGFGDGIHSTTVNGSGSGSYQIVTGPGYAVRFSTLTLQSDKLVVTSDLGPSAVPLPASAPLFGAALLALGAGGLGMRRKAAASRR